MRKLLLGAAIAFASFSTQAQYAEAFLGGRLISFEVFNGTEWIDAISSAGDPTLGVYLTYYDYQGSYVPCQGTPDRCGSYATDGTGPSTYGILKTVGGIFHNPVDPACTPLGLPDCWPLFPWYVENGVVDTVQFSHHAMTDYPRPSGGYSVLYERTYFDLVGDFLSDAKPAAIYTALGQLNESVTGTGQFISEFFDTPGDLKYGYRGTFTITSAYVPTPGTLALLAMGLVFGLRRRH